MIPSHVVIASATTQAATASPDSVDMRTALLFVILVVLVFCIKVVTEMRHRLQSLEAKLDSPQEEIPEPTDDGLTPEIVAAITAAVVCSVGADHRIVSLVPVTQEKMAWSLEGRRQVFQSHKVR